MSDSKGNVILIPLPISGGEEMHLPDINKAMLSNIKYFIVERVRTARRFIRKANPDVIIDELVFLEIDKHNRKQDFKPFLNHALDGHHIGLMSEAGVPAVADPGTRVLRQAHRLGLNVIPLVGPSSIILALMASGMNGQQFIFDGYLPRDRKALESALQKIQLDIRRSTRTHIFIEAPYRNNRLVDTIIKTLDHALHFCVACDLLEDEQYICSTEIRNWVNMDRPDLHKRPAIFLLGV